ncbi:MAG: hypothetical protein PWQ59_2358 [Thermoanaerobacterium sp.]|nr:hypothetical protein [Thermoanaerobacterium sp.]MDN5317029.1 hypothetical protein [Thermoanaerobacterium sp.]
MADGNEYLYRDSKSENIGLFINEPVKYRS